MLNFISLTVFYTFFMLMKTCSSSVTMTYILCDCRAFLVNLDDSVIHILYADVPCLFWWYCYTRSVSRRALLILMIVLNTFCTLTCLANLIDSVKHILYGDVPLFSWWQCYSHSVWWSGLGYLGDSVIHIYILYWNAAMFMLSFCASILPILYTFVVFFMNGLYFFFLPGRLCGCMYNTSNAIRL